MPSIDTVWLDCLGWQLQLTDLLVLGRNPFSPLLNVDVDDDSAAWSRRRPVDVCCEFLVSSRLLRSASAAARATRSTEGTPRVPSQLLVETLRLHRGFGKIPPSFRAREPSSVLRALTCSCS